ncbi:Holliday junction resolvasome RuvABC endonuclease subunit [Bradyrhizobium elkanii]
MKIVGFNFHKGRIRLVVLEWAIDKPSYVGRKVVDIDSELPLPELTDRYISHLRGLLDEISADAVAVRLVWESGSLDEAKSQIMPAGLLALVCHEKNLPLHHYTMQALRSGKPFGLDKSKKPIEEVDILFGDHPPYWDNLQRVALLVAWRALLDSHK